MLSLTDLQRRLEVVRQRERNVALVTGVSRSIAVLLGGVLSYLLLDWLFEPPLWARWLAVLGILAYVGYTVRRYLILELRKIHDDDEIALRIEARNPELRGRLISTVQLARASKRGEYAGSAELLEALENDTLESAAPLDFLKIIDKDLMVKFSAAAVAIVLIKLACLIQFPGYFEAMAERLVDPDKQFPTKVRIKELQAPANVARGDSVAVLVLLEETSQEPTEPGTLVFQSILDGTETPVELVAQGPRQYAGALAKALDSVRVMAKLGDGKSQWQEVKVMARPEVAEGLVRYRFPAYTKEADPPPDRFGGLSALQGSTAEIEIVSTKPLAQAQIKRMDEKVLALVQTDTEGKAWKLPEPFAIDKSTSYFVELLDRDGLRNSQPPVVYPVNAKPDMPPMLKLLRPTRDRTVTPRTKLDVAFDLRDDYGLRTVWLVYQHQREGETEGTGTTKRYELPLPDNLKGSRSIPNLPFSWDLDALGLKVGDQIVFWLEGDDECAANDFPPEKRVEREGAQEPAAQEAEYPHSGNVKLTVISTDEKNAELHAEVARILEVVRTLNDQQSGIKEELMKLIESHQREIKDTQKP
ncbi:MAG: hypothetical protein HS116_20415 [Planctomycetes bacterium]|nr:hypothetical protein [Planctomycetota bacterium]